MTQPQRTYTVGLDLGQAQDPSAAAVLEHEAAAPDPLAGVTVLGPRPQPEPASVPPARVVYTQRWPLQTPYPTITQDVAAMVAELAHQGRAILAVDKTGVGAAPYDEFVEHFRRMRMPEGVVKPRLVGILIHGGDQVSAEHGVYRVPKRDLAGLVKTRLQQDRLWIHDDVQDAETLRAELANFKVTLDAKTGHDRYGAGDGWRSQPHDDLVLAVAIALWTSEQGPRGPAMSWV